MAEKEMIPESKEDVEKAVWILKSFFKVSKLPHIYGGNKEWEKKEVIQNSNCYMYIFDITFEDPEDRVMSFLGWTDGKIHQHATGKRGYRRFEADLRNLGFKYEVTKDEVSLPKKGCKIALYIYANDFHFARQDRDGLWSEKDGFGGEVRRLTDSDGNPITPSQVPQDEKYTLRVYNIYI